MAISYTQPTYTIDISNPPIKEYGIQGKVVAYQLRIADELFDDKMINPDEIKKQLVQGLIEKIVSENVIEFTRYETVIGEKMFTARIFVVPDTQVRILRELKMI